MRGGSLVSEQLGGYELVTSLGTGGMAEVWLGVRRNPGEPTRTAAIKVARPGQGRDPRIRRLFRREAEIGALLQHANIVRVLDHGETEETCFIVMEHVDGSTLLKLEPTLASVCDERLRMQLAVHIMMQVLKALSYAHRVRSDAGFPLGIVHRDVSPHNILVSHAGEVKLLDWGISHLAPNVSMYQSVGEIYGKPRYMAPEHVGGKHRDPRIDLFAAGAVLHELLDAKTFRGDTPTKRILPLVLTGRRPPLTRRIPGELERVLDGLLAPEPEDRTPNARAAIDGLRRWPDCSDMSEELAELCRRTSGIDGPRTTPPLPRAATPVVPPVDRTVVAPTPIVSQLPEHTVALAPTFPPPAEEHTAIVEPPAFVEPPGFDRTVVRGAVPERIEPTQLVELPIASAAVPSEAAASEPASSEPAPTEEPASFETFVAAEDERTEVFAAPGLAAERAATTPPPGDADDEEQRAYWPAPAGADTTPPGKRTTTNRR